jgi:hypothetical protein
LVVSPYAESNILPAAQNGLPPEVRGAGARLGKPEKADGINPRDLRREIRESRYLRLDMVNGGCTLVDAGLCKTAGRWVACAF